METIAQPYALLGSDVIRTEGLTKTYRSGVTAVDHLDLSVGQGEIFGLLGPNGAGKTTTIGMLTTRVVPTSGTALVGGLDVVAQPALAKQVIGVVHESNTLDRKLNAWENLYFHGRYFGLAPKVARERADQLLERFQLADRARARVEMLSRGMAQRLMIARGILHRPGVLFLDEPTAGLDPQSRLALWEILRELHAEGQSILLTTHYMEEADLLCQRVAIMDHGRLLAVGPPAELKRTYGTGVTVTVKGRGSFRRLAAALGPMAADGGPERLDGALRLRVKSARGVLPKVVAAAEGGGFRLTDVSVSEPTLESVFIALTGKELRE